MLSRATQRGFVQRASPLATLSTSTPPFRFTPYAPLQQQRGISELALAWITCIALPAVVQGWSPTPVKRNPRATQESSGDFFNKPKDAPPGWLPRPAFWQPGMPQMAFMHNIIPPREGYRQWQSWEAGMYYLYGLLGFGLWWFWISDRYTTDKSGEYWLMRLATDYIPPAEDLPKMNPFDVLDQGVHRSIWHDRYCMTYWAARFSEFSPHFKERYWKTVSQYTDSREEFQRRVDMMQADTCRVDMETLSFAFIPESNAFIDQIKIRAINKIVTHARNEVPAQSHDYWVRQIRTLNERRLDSPTRALAAATDSPETTTTTEETVRERMRHVYDSVEKAWYQRTDAWLKWQEWRLRQAA